MEDVRRALLEELPDDVMHVEVRGLLRRQRPLVIEGQGGLRSGFVFAPAHDLAVGFGAPDTLALERLVAAARVAGLPLERLEIHVREEVAARWSDAGFTEPARPVQILRWAGVCEAEISDLIQHEAWMLLPDDEALATLPAHLQRELTGLGSWPACAASFAGEAIASLVYAFVETETLWDVSIDTLGAFRREGFATSSAAFLIQHQLKRGLRPVWGASTANAASLALAARLGFEPEAMLGSTVMRPAFVAAVRV